MRGEKTYLRFGRLPEGGISYDGLFHDTLAGVVAFRATKKPKGGYSVDMVAPH